MMQFGAKAWRESFSPGTVGRRFMFGYSADEVIGEPVTILIPPQKLDEVPDIWSGSVERIDHYQTVR